MNVAFNFPIIDDLISASQRSALAIAEGWAPSMLRLVRRAIRVQVEAGSPHAGGIDGAALKEEFDPLWLRFARGPRQTSVVIALGGPIVEHLVPAVADLAISSLSIQWDQQLGAGLVPVTQPEEIDELRQTFFAADALVCASLELTSPAQGRLIIAARPQAWI